MEKRGSVLGNLDRSWLAAGIDDLRPAPLRDLTGRRLAVVAGKAKPTATHMKPAFSKARRRGRAALVARREGLIRGTERDGMSGGIIQA